MQKARLSRDYRQFLSQLRAARIAAGLTQKQLAKRLGVTQSFVSKCERGERRLDVVELRAFCAAIGIAFTAFARQFDKALFEKASEDEGGH